jgi:hypothetical protein
MEIQPKDPSQGHFYVSLAKSFVRIAAGAALMLAWYELPLQPQFIAVAGGLLIVAEGLGILEELV